MSLDDPVTSAECWLARFREAAAQATAELDRRSEIGDRLREVGTVGAGGDRTLEIDAIAEEAVFVALGGLADEGALFTAISEERGVVAFGGGQLRVLIDPIDGSLNAARGLTHCAMSIAVADGPTSDDLALGFVWDFGAREEFVAVRGRGVSLNGTPIKPPVGERRSRDGRLELLAVEASDSASTAQVAPRLAASAYRWRILGSVASALCQVATPRVDAMVNVSRCRIIDAAAAILVVRESGGHVRLAPGRVARLELDARTRIAAARSEGTADVLSVQLKEELDEKP